MKSVKFAWKKTNVPVTMTTMRIQSGPVLKWSVRYGKFLFFVLDWF